MTTLKKRSQGTLRLLTRQVAEILPTQKGLEGVMRKKKIRVYLGIDPTGSNLHLGHTVPLRKIQQFADQGHEAILVIGTGTVLAGDPSQRRSARPRITEKEIAQNIKTWKKQAAQIINFSKVKLRYNGDWLKKLTLKDMIEIASHISAVRLFQRDMFQRRIRQGDTVWMHETFYPLLQGYDSVVLDVDLEIGGTDQVFNMLIGRELQQKMRGREKFILTVPMITGLDGKPMSKTSNNTVNITDSPQDMYGKLMSLRDDLVFEYFEMCTDVPMDEIKRMQKKLSPRDFKAKLAKETVSMYHGKKAAKEAEREFVQVFREKKQPKFITRVIIKKKKLTLVDLLRAGDLASSRSEARRLVEQGGVKIDGILQMDPNRGISLKKGMVLQVGKRRFAKIG